MSASIELTTPVGRIVGGHPMQYKPKMDDKTKAPKLNKLGESINEMFFALAIPKGPEAHWNQTPWGAQIWKVGVDGWARGEWQMPTFAWKIVDGDSRIPNRKMKIPADREGYAGHWVISFSTSIPVGCFHPVQAGGIYPQMQSEKEIKCGDYVMVNALFKDNAPSESAGIYANPKMVLLVQAGVAIISDGGGDPTAAFGGQAPTLPAGAYVDNNPAPLPAPVTTAFAPPPAATPPPVAPAPDFLTPKVYNIGGVNYSGEQLKQAGWTDAQLAAL